MQILERVDGLRLYVCAREGVGCINSARPAEYASLQGEIEFSHRTPPRLSHTRRRSACPRQIPLSTQVRKRVRLGQK